MNLKPDNPPRLSEWLMKHLSWSDDQDAILDNLREEYAYRLSTQGKAVARWWYRLHVLRSVIPFIAFDLKWRLTMLKNYLKNTFRSLSRYKVHTFMNIAGMAVGMASSIIIILFVIDELSYDKHHEKVDQIYRIRVKSLVEGRTGSTIYTPELLASTLEREFPEVEIATRLSKRGGFPVFRYKDKVFSEEKTFRADNTIFKVFTFKFIAGNPENALTDPNAIVLTQSSARKYFAGENPIGKTINADNRRDYMVTAVIEDIPENSHFHFDFLRPLPKTDENANWLNLPTCTYILLKKNTNLDDVSNKIKFIVSKYLAPFIEEADNMPFDEWEESGNRVEYLLQSLTNIHLHSNYIGEFEPNGNITTLYFISIIAVLILIISCVNYVNLETARASKRSREMGMRKILGANTSKIASYLLTESTVMSFLSFFFSILLVFILLPIFNRLFDKSLTVALLYNVMTIPVIILSIVLIGLVTGLYASISLSTVKTSTVLKSINHTRKKTSILRNALVIFQFIASIFVISATWIVFDQIKYSMNIRLGFNKNQLLVIKKVDDIAQKMNVFKHQLKNLPGVIAASNSSSIPGKELGMRYHRLYGGSAKSNLVLWGVYADYDFLNTYQFNLLQGRDFSTDFSTELDAVILNQTAVQAFGLDEPVGKYITPIGTGRKLKIIGVVEDFHFHSVHEEIKPIRISVYHERGYGRYMSVRVKTQNINETIMAIEKLWHLHAGNQAFEYAFLDSEFEGLYNSEKELGRLFSTFSILAIMIACLGLFGLASFTISDRTKEIGIRKVLGASVTNISTMLLQQFIRWVFLAAFIAWPITYFVMRKWLQNFAYRTNPGVDIFLLSGLAALTIALLTVSYKTIKTATANPVDALHYE